MGTVLKCPHDFTFQSFVTEGRFFRYNKRTVPLLCNLSASVLYGSDVLYLISCDAHCLQLLVELH